MRRVRIALWSLIAAALMVIGGLHATQQLQSSTSGSTGGSTSLGPSVVLSSPFTLVTQDGREVTRATFSNKPTAWFFGFTHCPDLCPTTLFQMTEHLRRLGSDADKINVVFISVDPERDTPAGLKEYLSSFDHRITALTGTLEQVQHAAKGFYAYFAKKPTDGGYTMEHTSMVLLTAKDGRFKGTLDFHEPIETQFQKLQRLAWES